MRLHKSFIILSLVIGAGLTSCTKLDEKLGSTLTHEQADSVIKVPALLITA